MVWAVVGGAVVVVCLTYWFLASFKEKASPSTYLLTIAQVIRLATGLLNEVLKYKKSYSEKRNNSTIEKRDNKSVCL